MIDHGTYRGWNQHKRDGIPVCKACKAAQARYVKEWRATREHERRAQAFLELGFSQ